jgi:TadE-like protein
MRSITKEVSMKLAGHNTNRGSAVVELLILLPVMVLILMAMMYIGHMTTFSSRTHFGAEYAVNAEGDQTEDQAVRGTVTETFYPGHTGELALVEANPTPADIPEPGEIRDVFDEMSEPIYSTYASGRYVFSNGQLRFIVSTHQSQALSKDGKYVASHRLREDNIPELSTDLLQGWEERRTADLTYVYQPGFINVGSWPLTPADLKTHFRSVVRGPKQREVVNPPIGMNHQIDAVTGNTNMTDSGQLPHYPDFRGDQQFWEPN